MKAYLIRHGQAVNETVDPNRPLTEKGRKDAEKSATFLVNAQIKIETIISSSKTRAVETAQIFAAKLLPRTLIHQESWLTPKEAPQKARDEIENKQKDIIVVGHLPFLANLASLFLTGDSGKMDIMFEECAVVCLERYSPDKWRLSFAINPQVL